MQVLRNVKRGEQAGWMPRRKQHSLERAGLCEFSISVHYYHTKYWDFHIWLKIKFISNLVIIYIGHLNCLYIQIYGKPDTGIVTKQLTERNRERVSSWREGRRGKGTRREIKRGTGGRERKRERGRQQKGIRNTRENMLFG